MTIRRATLDEVPAVVALAREAFMDAVAPLYSEEGVRTFMEFVSPAGLRERMAENCVTYVAYRGRELVGVAHVRDGSHVAMLFVVPRAQRTGVGRALLAVAVGECTSDVVTVKSSPNAEGAYQRYGFKRTAPEQTDRGIRFIPMAVERKAFNPTLKSRLPEVDRAPSSREDLNPR
jgi:GNAT superfamily N-acetyltransferase